ncbi:uncharacterized protein LOC132300866 [Cornus florida]|uniref:uncharacterized protein LOC132300866 n=1 Tax=Cornus florida TaxID=4283 RepID=UPI0028A06E25|nr:uncharacterized protein LOC132300866 [Cornus florida]
MEDCVKVCTKKLALWHTRTFKPLIVHDDLEPIMATIGFVAVPLSPAQPNCGGDTSTATAQWKEYMYSAGWWRNESPQEPPPPSPRLPYPRLDGLHISIYRNFLDVLNFYIQMPDISELFHIRGMPLNRVHDLKVVWKRMEKEDDVFVYRAGTLDQKIYDLYLNNKNDNDSSSSRKERNSVLIGDNGKDTPATCIVPLKDIIVEWSRQIP